LNFDFSILFVHQLETPLDLETNMLCSHNVDRSRERPLIVNDLCAQLAPLNRYGLADLGAAVADGARALIGASRTAATSVLRIREEN
jgi:hypothetical protein